MRRDRGHAGVDDAEGDDHRRSLSEVIVHACRHRVDPVLQAEDGHSRANVVGEQEPVAAEVIVVVFERCGPMRREGPIHARAPARRRQ